MAKKSTKAEVNRRVQIVIKLLCQRVGRQEILRYMRNKEKLNISESQIERYIAKANEQLKNQRAYNRDIEFMKLKKALDGIYIRAKKDKDHRTCLMVVKELSELMGLKEYKPFESKTYQLNIEASQNIYSNMSEEELIKEWDRRKNLLKKYNDKKPISNKE